MKKATEIKIPVEVSARHAHLSRSAIDVLFGKGHQLKKLNGLSQQGEFAAEEKVILANQGKRLEARVLGPERKEAQVEISLTDAKKLGVKAPLRLSGDLAGSAGIEILGPRGKVRLEQGLIIAKRHLHASDSEAKELGVKNGDVVSIRISGERALVFENVAVRAGRGNRLALHIDTDEGNAAGAGKDARGELILQISKR